jgi:hypothetical protein
MSVFIIAGCDEVKEYNYDRYIFMGVKSLEMYCGDEHQLEISPVSERDRIVYTSENTSVATVSDGGKVRATGEGLTTIVATLDGKQTQLQVTVRIPTVDNIMVAGADGSFRIIVRTLSDKIKTARVFYNDGRDSTDIDIDNKVGVFNRLISYSGENGYLFRIVSFDRLGNRSTAIETTAIFLQNRETRKVVSSGDKLIVMWQSNTLYADHCRLSYTSSEGVPKTIDVPAGEMSTVIDDYSEGLRYVTLFSLYDELQEKFFKEEIAPEFDIPYLDEWPFLSRDGNEGNGDNRLYAINFDLGGEGIGFHDTDSENAAGYECHPRYNNGDLESEAADAGCDMIEDIRDGEWWAYTFEVKEEGYYEADVFILLLTGDYDGSLKFSMSVDDDTRDIEMPWIYPQEPFYALGESDDYYHKYLRPRFYLTEGIHQFKFTARCCSGVFELHHFLFKYIDYIDE